MIRLGKVNQMELVKALPVEIQGAVKNIVEILDSEYGGNRDVEKDLGGYVAVVSSQCDIERLVDYNINIQEQEPEWIEHIATQVEEVWSQAMYMLSDDYSVIVVAPKSILGI